MSSEKSVSVTVFDPITGEYESKNTDFVGEEEVEISEDLVEDPLEVDTPPEEPTLPQKIQDLDVDSYSHEAYRERDEAIEQAKAYKQEALSAKKEKYETQKHALSLFMTDNEGLIEELKAEIISAAGVQDHARVAELQMRLQDVNAKLHKARNAVEDVEKQLKTVDIDAERATRETPAPKSAPVPLAARMWAKGKEVLLNAEAYATLPKEKRAHLYKVRESVGSIVQSMITEGMSPDTSVFYEDLDMRLADKFPAYQQFLTGGVDAVGKAEAKKAVSTAAKGPSYSGPSISGKSKRTLSFSMLPKESQDSYERNFLATMSKADYDRAFAENNRELVKELLNK